MGVGVGGFQFEPLSVLCASAVLRVSMGGRSQPFSRDAAGPQTKDRMILGAGGACTN